MANLTAAQLYGLALQAGFPPSIAVQMVAIALKESGGNPLAHNAVPPDDSYGLWQINMFQGINPNSGNYVDLLTPRLASFGISDPTALYDPAVNAAAAYQIWGGNPNNLNIAWAINDGGLNQARYESFLPAAQSAAASFGQAAGITGGGGGTFTGVSVLPAAPASVQQFLAETGLGPLWASLPPSAKLGAAMLGAYVLVEIFT